MIVLGRCVRTIAFVALGLACSLGAGAADPSSVDALLAEISTYLFSTPEKAVAPLEKLQALQSSFTPVQNERYQLYYASSLGFRGRHEERISLVQSFLPQVKTPARRARFLYELIDGSTVLGRYEAALLAMNQSILLLPRLESAGEKMNVLQSALALSSSLHAYDEALDFAERLYSLSGDTVGSYAACVGLTDKVELNFMRGDRQQARSLVPDAILACDANKNQFFTLLVKTLVAIDLIDSEKYATGIASGLPLLRQFSVLSQSSDYVTQLEEALARAYLKTGNVEQAEHYGFQAYQRAQSGKVLLLQEKTSETMAAIQRAQGQLVKAMGYYDINLALKKKVLDDQLQKNLAYQRVKFETQDKANQMALLEQKNKNLNIEKELQQGRNQNLILLMTLSLVVLTLLGVWLAKTLRQRNIFRQSAQVDGLTQVSNRAHFVASARQVFRSAKTGVSLVLLDMDFFKKINDTYGHATGDWVLRAVCDAVKTQLRKTDLLGRLGGEEFALCLPLFTPEEAKAMAERCRAAIAAIDTGPSGFSFEITASLGIASRDINGPLNFEETLAAADKALYFSKNEGRNRVTVYQHSGA
ncbi:MAG: GGDEF domain-containing protein [Rhodoferax sp.]|uniref:tetratricopeptide repeat-containing diguanylate cyclase n=1 Tax=Rhodoferax sp. TaxID=50421 RepID=UPI002638D657|nr:GGDEF domain-containing protein [Rhodoferax sp.]MDD5333157.1 GGDEF domain-containing protein [Rhodoferax sp.]